MCFRVICRCVPVDAEMWQVLMWRGSWRRGCLLDVQSPGRAVGDDRCSRDVEGAIHRGLLSSSVDVRCSFLLPWYRGTTLPSKHAY